MPLAPDTTGNSNTNSEATRYKPPSDAPPPHYGSQQQAHYDAGPYPPQPDPTYAGQGGYYNNQYQHQNQGFYGQPPPQQGYYGGGPGPGPQYYGQPQPQMYYGQQQPMYGPPQGGYYNDGRGGGMGGGGVCAGIMGALACCCCLDMLF